MLCPNCKTENLVTSERQNVQIDHCPRCRGVWLDRGELEKLIQMASTDDERQSGRNNDDADDDDGRGNERGESHQSRDRDDGDRGSERGDSYGSRDRDYDQRTGRGEPEGGRSIWREIFENLGDKLPRS